MQSNSVAEFTQKPYKRYSCKQIRVAQKNLAKAFKPTGASKMSAQEERGLFKRLVNSMNKTEKGRETLVELNKLGYSFVFEVGPFGGYCSHENKKIVINPEKRFEHMQAMMVHEGQHAFQKKYEGHLPYREYMNADCVFKFSRAKEADATAHEAAFIYQIRETSPGYFSDEIERGRTPIRAYAEEMDRTKDQKKAMQAAFKDFYTSDFYQKFYDKNHKNFIRKYAEFGIKNNIPGIFGKTFSDKEIADTCRFKGQTYISPEFLSSEQAYAIPKEDKKEILAFTKSYAEVMGEKHDTSIMKMHDRPSTDKERKPQSKTHEKGQAVISALAVRKKIR